jgi:hypothetical protein
MCFYELVSALKGWMTKDSEFDFCKGQTVIFFSLPSRQAVQLTQPMHTGAHSLKVKQLLYEVDHSPPSSAKFKYA